MNLRTRQIGDPILHTAPPPFQFPATPELDDLLRIMQKELRVRGGVGISCNQCLDIAKPYNITIIGTDDQTMQAKAKQRYPTETIPTETIMINLKITEYSQATYYPEHGEGCLSVYGPVRASIKRHHNIVAEYDDVHGKHHKQAFSGFIAHIVQHEYNHLCGSTFFDQVFADLDVSQHKTVRTLVQDVLQQHNDTLPEDIAIQPCGLAFYPDAAGALQVDKDILRIALTHSATATCKGILNRLNQTGQQ